MPKLREIPKEISPGEWWYMGCFIQEVEEIIRLVHRMPRFTVFQDTDQQHTVGNCHTFTEAKKIASENKVDNYQHGPNGW